MSSEPIFLIGARGCGKTTVGQKLALACRFAFVDSDRMLQARAGKSIADIVALEGWDSFRALEARTLRAVTEASAVIATGGGVILAPENRTFMRERGRVIYLQAPVPVLARRLEASPEEEQRPTLTGKPIRDEVGEVLAQREALYRAAAHHIINATATPDEVVEQIMTTVCGETYTS